MVCVEVWIWKPQVLLWSRLDVKDPRLMKLSELKPKNTSTDYG